MKKAIGVLLLLALVVGLFGCGNKQASGEADQSDVDSFQVGFCRKVMNPAVSVPLAGYGNSTTRYFTEIGDDITATAVAISDDQGNHVVLISTDLIMSYEQINQSVRMEVNQKTGIPENNIVITGCHSHSAPDVEVDLPEVVEYKEYVISKIVEAAVEAVADRKPAEMYTGSVETENLNFIKHYYYVDAEGEKVYFGDNFGTQVLDATTEHATEVDATMHLLRFTREGGKDVVITNWRAHPHFTGGSSRYVLSSDYIATFRYALEELSGANVVYFQGASGNVNSSTRLSEESRTSDHRVFGNMLAQHALEGLNQNMTKVETGRIQTKQVDFYGEINHSQNALYSQAIQVQAVWAQTNSWDSCRPLMEPYGIRSPYHANAIVANFKRTEADGRMTISAISIGEDFALVTFPGELFDTISVQMEEKSPYQSTMLLGYANHHIGYLPSAAGFEYSCYESDITRFVPGTGELLCDQYISMLNELKNS